MAALAVCGSTSYGQTRVADTTVTGTVLRAPDHPVPDVQVTGFHHFSGGGYEPRSTKTDADGRFELSEIGPVIFFRATGLKPELRVGPFPGAVQVVVEDAAVASRQVPLCTSVRSSVPTLRITPPKGMKVKRTCGTDTCADEVWSPKHPDSHLVIWRGPGNYSLQPALFSGFAREDWILASKEVSQRLLVNGQDVVAMETVGIDATGNHWRWIWDRGGIVYYEKADSRTADLLNSLIDSACVN